MAVPRWAPLTPLLAVVVLLALPARGSGGGTGTPADAASAVLVVVCLVRVARARARPLSRTAAVVLGLPVLGVCAAAVTSGDPAASLPGVVRHLQVFVLVPAAVVLLLRDRRDFALVAWSLVALALVEGAVGTVQYATGTGASYQGEDVRAVGTFGPTDVMGMATVVASGLVVAVGLALATTGGSRVAAAVCAGLLVVPLVVSFSRGAWIATLVACGAQLVLSGARRAVRVALVAGAAGVVLVAGFGAGTRQVGERVASIARVADAPDRSVGDRYVMWAAAAGMWRTAPLTGVGPKGFPRYRDGHASLALSSGSDIAGAGTGFRRQPLESPHNMYLLVLAEQGLLGLVTTAGAWAALLVGALRRLRGARTAYGAYEAYESYEVRGWRGMGGARGAGGAEGADRAYEAYEVRGGRGMGGVRGAGGAEGAGGARGLPHTRPAGAGAFCGLVAVGLLVRQLVDFAYADIGGPSTVLTALVLGLAAWWALAPRALGAGHG